MKTKKPFSRKIAPAKQKDVTQKRTPTDVTAKTGGGETHQSPTSLDAVLRPPRSAIRTPELPQGGQTRPHVA